MKAIVCGAGQVGWQIARQLSVEGHDVVLIDEDAPLIQRANDALDVQGVIGRPSHPDVLDRAGAADCDLLVAATPSDEVNIVACEIASALFAVPRRIACLRGLGYLLPQYADLYQATNLSIDVVISPERAVARAALGRLDAPGAFDTEQFMAGRVRLLAMALTEDCPVLNTALRHLDETFARSHAIVAGIRRGGRLFAPEPGDQLRAGDRAYVVTADQDTARTLDLFGRPPPPIRRVLVIGGGAIGMAVAEALESRRDIDVKLIERDPDQAERAADCLSRAIVLQGDGMAPDLLAEAGVTSADAVLTLTDDDRTNLLTAVRARQAGARMTIALVADPSLQAMAETLGIDAQINPRSVTVSSVLRHLRRGLIRDVYTLGDTEAELIEAQILPGSPLAGASIRTLDLPRGTLIVALDKGGTLIRPRPDTPLVPGDLVLIFTLSGDIPEVERLLQVSADWF